MYRRADFWNVDSWYTDPSGHRLSAAAEESLTARLTRQHLDPYTWLTRHGYTLWHSFQPADRFWTFQVIEASGLLALAAAGGAATVWWIRRRTA